MSSNQTPDVATLAGLIGRAVDTRLAGVHTGAVGEVKSYNANKQTVDVQPIVRGWYEDGESFKFPLLVGVPVRFPSGGGYALTFPIKAGDFVWLDFGERSLDEWLAFGGADITPQNSRRFDLADAVAFAGIRPTRSPLKSASTADLVLGEDKATGGLQLAIGPSGIGLGSGPDDVLHILRDLIMALQSAQTAATGEPLDPATQSLLAALLAAILRISR